MPRRHDDYEDDDRPRRRGGAEFPAGVKFAGIVWIGVGILGLLLAAGGLIVAVLSQAAPPGQGGPPNFCGPVCVTLIGLVFLMVGIQTVKGTAKSTLGNGIGSIIFGVGGLGLAVLLFAVGGLVAGAGAIAVVFGIGYALLGLALLVAGVLALMGKSAYEDWRAAQGLDRPKRRSQEERDYDDDRRRRRRSRDDEDDRPRRRRDADDEDRPRRPRRDDDE